MRSRYFYFFFLVFFIPFFSQAAPVTGPISNATILAYKPVASLDTIGLSRINVPVLAGETAGMATVSTRAAAGRLLAAAGRGFLGPWGMAAITAASLCYEETDWKICHSTIDPILPIDVDTSLIVPATSIVNRRFYMSESSLPSADHYDRNSLATAYVATNDSTYYTWSFVGFTSDTCLSGSVGSKCAFTFSAVSKSTGATSSYSRNLIYDGTFVTNYSCSSGILTNSSGAPMSVTGQYCTPETAYSCPANYSRSDSYGNLGSDGMFCSYQAPVLTQQQQQDILAPYLLNYYANQLFSDTSGKPLTDIFSDADTTFDPTVTPADMPMTWTQLQTYVDWYTSGKAQTTNPLAQYYVSPTNYQYTQNYVNTTNQTNTNADVNTNISPTSVASSSAMTQTQYESSNKKADTEQATAFTSAFTGVTTALDSLSKDKEEIIGNIGSPDAPPSEMPDIFNWTWPAGSCQGFDLDLNLYIPIVGTLNLKKTVNEHCPPYNEYFHPTFFWFFNMITLLYVFRLWDKTAADVAKI